MTNAGAFQTGNISHNEHEEHCFFVSCLNSSTPFNHAMKPVDVVMSSILDRLL